MGDIRANSDRHQSFIELAVSTGAELVVFPELSITGYEPTLAKDLAIEPDDRRFDEFQSISDAKQITIAIGAPTRSPGGICISLLLFQPGRLRQVYSKMHLHADEEPFFVRGPVSEGLIGTSEKAALAICYELSVPEHAAAAFQNGAAIYIASVAKTAAGVENAVVRLSEIARDYAMTVLMANCVGLADSVDCAGGSAVWNNEGVMLCQLDDASEGLMVLDTETQSVAQHMRPAGR